MKGPICTITCERQHLVMDRKQFPITGVVGVVGGGPKTVEDQLERLEKPPKASVVLPDALEVRADLFDTSKDALDVVSRLARNWRILFTARLRSQGGSYQGETA